MKIALIVFFASLNLVIAEETKPLFKSHRFDDNNLELKKYEGPYLGAIKDIPLPLLKLDVGADLRVSREWTIRPNFGSVSGESQGYWLQRYAVHFNLRGPDDWRVFTQFKYSKETGKSGRPSTLDNDNPDVQQLFVDKKIYLTGQEILARVGRQEVSIGSGRFISFRDGPNSRLSFDGFRISDSFAKKQVELFVARPVVITPGSFDNEADKNNLIASLYGARLVNEEKYSVDASLSYFEKEGAQYQHITEKENRYTLGSRILTFAGRLKTDTDIALQFGNFGNKDILAYGVASELSLKMEENFSLLGKLSYFSGDHSSGDSKLNTFNAYYARATYYGWSTQIGYPNLIAIQPGLSYRFNPMFLIVSDYGMYWRQSLKDSVYNGVGSPIILPLADADKRFVGSQFNTEMQVALNSLTTLDFEYSYFFHAGYTEHYSDTQYFASRFLVKF